MELTQGAPNLVNHSWFSTTVKSVIMPEPELSRPQVAQRLILKSTTARFKTTQGCAEGALAQLVPRALPEVIVNRSTITNNTAERGGGLYAEWRWHHLDRFYRLAKHVRN